MQICRDSSGLASAILKAAAAAALLCLGACGGGGGGGGGGTGTAVASPTPPTVTAPVVTPVGPVAGSAEDLRNPGVSQIKAESAWAQGASGRGIVVAVIDSGMDGTGPDLAGRASPLSTDLIASRGQITGPDRHGTYVAGVIASNFNNQGTVGVAFESTILAIRADSTTASCPSGPCFLTSDLARGIDYATANGARIINMSFGSGETPAGSTFEAALQRAVAAGLVVAAAAGNDSSSAAHYPASYAVDPRFAGSMIAVGSINSAGVLSSFSNSAGAAANDFLVAPGEGVITDCTSTGCWNVSGTSFAAPHVAGALALVLQAFPNLTGRDAVDLLLRTARDLGAPGTDPVYGRGELDLQRAFAPAGSLSVPVAGGGAVAEGAVPGTMMGAAFGDALQASGALRTVGWDFYRRPFPVDLAQAYPGPRSAMLAPVAGDLRDRTHVDLALASGARLNMTASQADDSQAQAAAHFPWMPFEASRDVSLTVTSGRLGFSAWTGKASASPFTAETPDPYSALAQSDHALKADYASGRWRLSVETGSGQRRSPDLMQQQDGSSYLRASGRTRLGSLDAAVTFGQLDEPMGPLGAYLPASTGLNLPSRTSFAAWNGVVPLNGDFTLFTAAAIGRTQLSGRFLSLQEPALSTSWSLTLGGACRAFGLNCQALQLTVAQPLRIEQGRFLARLPDVPSDYFGAVNFSDRQFEASPSGRQIDITLTALQRTMLNGTLRLDAVASTQPGHDASADTGYGLMTSWRAGF